MFKSIASKVFGSRNDRELKRLTKRVTQINALEARYAEMSDEQLQQLTSQFRER